MGSRVMHSCVDAKFSAYAAVFVLAIRGGGGQGVAGAYSST